MSFRKVIFTLAKTFCYCLTLYLILLTMAFSIPNNLVKNHVDSGLSVINQEGSWPKLFFAKDSAGMLDNFTDRVMLTKALVNEYNGLGNLDTF